MLTDALVLTCGHDLCLTCAANALRQTRSLTGRMVRCLLCPSTTELCEEAAAALAAPAAPCPPASSSGAPAYPPPQLGSACGGSSGRGAPRFAEQWDLANHVPGGAGNVAAPVPSLFAAAGMPAPKTQQAYLDARPGASAGPPGPPIPRRRPGDAAAGDSLEGPSKGRATSSSLTPRLAQPHQREEPPPAGTPAVPSPRWAPRERSPEKREAILPAEASEPWSGRMLRISRCPEHPEEPAMYFCATCECACICAECVVQKSGRHRDHEVMRATRAHEALRARAGALMDEAVALEDDFAMVADRLAWRRKDVERAAARGRASVRSAFARVRAQLTDREAELLESLDIYETDSLSRLDHGTSEHESRLGELKHLQESLRSRCRNGGDAVEALNTYAAAKATIAELREAFRQDDYNTTGPPDEFVGLAGSARAELDLHAEGLASLEEAVASLCERGVDFAPVRPGGEHRAEAASAASVRERGGIDAGQNGQSVSRASRAAGSAAGSLAEGGQRSQAFPPPAGCGLRSGERRTPHGRPWVSGAEVA